LTGIAVTTLPTKTVYFVGESLNTAGMEVTAYYNDSSNKLVTEYDYDPKVLTVVGTQTIMVSYGGEKATFDVTVNPVALTGIAVTTLPTKTVYFVGESLNTAGMEVTAYYNDGSNNPVTGYDYDPNVLTVAGTQAIMVSYGGEKATFDVTVISKTSIVVTGVRPEFQAGMQRSIETRARSVEWIWVYEPKFYDAPEVIFDVTDYEGPFRLWVGIEDVYPGIYVDVVEYVEDQEDTRNDIGEYFYDIEIPEGIVGAGIYFGNNEWYVNGFSGGDSVTMLKTQEVATVVYFDDEGYYEKPYIPDDATNPFVETVVEPSFDISFIMLGTTRVGPTSFDYELTVSVTNNGAGAKNVTASLANYPTNVTVIQGDLTFGDIPAGAMVTSANSFTIRIDRAIAFDGSLLEFDFYYSGTE